MQLLLSPRLSHAGLPIKMTIPLLIPSARTKEVELMPTMEKGHLSSEQVLHLRDMRTCPKTQNLRAMSGSEHRRPTF